MSRKKISFDNASLESLKEEFLKLNQNEREELAIILNKLNDFKHCVSTPFFTKEENKRMSAYKVYTSKNCPCEVEKDFTGICCCKVELC